MRKPYENRKVIDPGRLNFVITFSEMKLIENDSGGGKVTRVELLKTKASRSEINAYDQLAVTMGATSFNQDCYYTIRARKSFKPAKDMDVLVNGEKYTIRGFAPLNVPVTYWKILCVKSDWTD